MFLQRALDPHGLMNPGKVFRLKPDGDNSASHVLGRAKEMIEGTLEGLLGDFHDERPEHAAQTGSTQYVGAPAGHPEGQPPASKHDATPPPPRDATPLPPRDKSEKK